MKECVTHHYACDCREAVFKRLLDLVKDCKKDLISGLETDGHRMTDVVFNMFNDRIALIDKAEEILKP